MVLISSNFSLFGQLPFRALHRFANEVSAVEPAVGLVLQHHDCDKYTRLERGSI